MTLPYTPNEQARQACLSLLRQIYLDHGQSEEGVQKACRAVAHLLSRVDLDDVCEAFEDITRGTP